MKTIGIIIFDRSQSLDIAGPLDVFSEANTFLLPDERYRLMTIGMDAAPMRCSNGLRLLADQHWSEVNEPIDTLLVAGGGSDLHEREFPPDFFRWLRAMARQCRRLGSICNGALILGRAGLLDNRTVTTHWDSASLLQTMCPAAQVSPDKIYIEDGNLYTSAGVTAGIDLSLFLLRQNQGALVSLNVAKRLVVLMQRIGSQSQLSPYINVYADVDSPIAKAQRHALENLRNPLSMAELAQAAHMSVRNFSRQFLKELHITPSQFVERARVDAARSMLESSATPLKTIAYACGFVDSERMRRAFVRCIGVTPQQYRNTFNPVNA